MIKEKSVMIKEKSVMLKSFDFFDRDHQNFEQKKIKFFYLISILIRLRQMIKKTQNI